MKSNFLLINYPDLFSAHLFKADHRKRRTRLGRHRRYPSRRRRPDRRRRFPKNETENRRNKIIRSSDRQKLRQNLLTQIQKGKIIILIIIICSSDITLYLRRSFAKKSNIIQNFTLKA